MNFFTGVFQGFFLDFKDTDLSLPSPPLPPCIDLSLPHQFLKSPPSLRGGGGVGGRHAASPHILNTCGKPCPVTHVFIEKILLHCLQSLSRFCNLSLLKQTIFNPMLFWDTPKYAENPQEYLQTVRWVQ